MTLPLLLAVVAALVVGAVIGWLFAGRQAGGLKAERDGLAERFRVAVTDLAAEAEARKAAEKPRYSVMDDVHTGQPSLALAQKVIERVGKAGLPADLIPAEITSISVSADGDVENSLRTAVLEFAETVRGVEKAIATTRRGGSVPDEFDIAPLGEVTEEEWRAHWPSAEPVVKGTSKKRKGRR